ncbi:ribosome-recycling factor [Patescibacteria group bacterium]|nr:ribosome-recycling factor [Patescibacteria group bacterium]MCL5091834.1 ribosome-recycling factor [Patescibacteria group bacterium]
MDPQLAALKVTYQKVTDHLREDLKSIRTGRANPAIVENLMVETYGGSTKLRLLELATILSEGPTILVIMPFDPSTISDIEKAILKSPLGLSPRTQGSRVTIVIPPLSQEQREKLSRLINQKVEEHKNQVRQLRDEQRKKIKQAFEEKIITEDNRYRLEKEIDDATQTTVGDIQTIRETKEKEIMQVG